MNENNALIFNTDNELEISVTLQDETVWLNRQQMALLFDRDIKTIGKHINNVFKEGELDEKVVVANFATVQMEGNLKLSDKLNTITSMLLSQWAIVLNRCAVRNFASGQLNSPLPDHSRVVQVYERGKFKKNNRKQRDKK